MPVNRSDAFELDMLQLFPGQQGETMASAYGAFASQHSGSSPVVVELFAATPAGSALNKTDPNTHQKYLADILNKAPASQPGPTGGLIPGWHGLNLGGWLLRIGEVALGVVLLAVGLNALLKNTQIGRATARSAKSAATVAAVA